MLAANSGLSRFRPARRSRFPRRSSLPLRRLCRHRRLHLLLPFILRLQIKRRPIAILNLVRPNMIQRRLNNRAQPVKFIFLLAGKARSVQHQDRLKASIGLRLALHRELRGVRRRVLWNCGSRRCRRRILSKSRSTGRRSGYGGSRRDRRDGGSQRCAQRKFTPRKPGLCVCRQPRVGLVVHRILSGMRARPGEGLAATLIAKRRTRERGY